MTYLNKLTPGQKGRVVGYTDETLFLHDHLYGIRNRVVEVVWEISARGKLR